MPRDDDFPVDPKKIECNQWRYTTDSSRLSRFRFDYGNRVIQVQWRNGWPDPHKCKWPTEAPPGRPIVGRKRAKALKRKGYIYGIYEDSAYIGNYSYNDATYEYYRSMIRAASRGHHINNIDKDEMMYRPMRGSEWKDSLSIREGTGPQHKFGHHDSYEEGP